MSFPTKEFRIQLIIHGLTQVRVAEHLRVHKTEVSQVVNNFRETPRTVRFLNLLLREMQSGKFKSLEDYDPDRLF